MTTHDQISQNEPTSLEEVLASIHATHTEVALFYIGSPKQWTCEAGDLLQPSGFLYADGDTPMSAAKSLYDKIVNKDNASEKITLPIPFNLNDWLDSNRTLDQGILCAPILICNDGFALSIQASEDHYCTPRNNTGPYTTVEINLLTGKVDELDQFAEDLLDPDDKVYSYVPISIVERLVISHGGPKEYSDNNPLSFHPPCHFCTYDTSIDFGQQQPEYDEPSTDEMICCIQESTATFSLNYVSDNGEEYWECVYGTDKESFIRAGTMYVAVRSAWMTVRRGGKL